MNNSNNFNLFAIQNLVNEYGEFHPSLYSYALGTQDYRDFFNQNNRLFPSFYMNVLSVRRTEQVNNWNLRVYVLDLLEDNRDNWLYSSNKAFEILNDFYNFIQFKGLKNKNISFSMQPVLNFDKSKMVGYMADITLEAKSLQCLDFVKLEREE